MRSLILLLALSASCGDDDSTNAGQDAAVDGGVVDIGADSVADSFVADANATDAWDAGAVDASTDAGPPPPEGHSTCGVLPPDECRGPRGPVGDVERMPVIDYAPAEVNNVRDFGAMGDGVTDDSDAVWAAAYSGAILYFPEGEYRLTRQIPLQSGIYGEGRIVSSAGVVFAAVADGVFMRGLSIESTAGGSTNAPILLSARDWSDIEVSYCTLINGRITHINTRNAPVSGLEIAHNHFINDFTPFDIVLQNDVITIRGVDGGSIHHNLIESTNAHRIFKFADTLGSPYPASFEGARITENNTRNIVVADNVVLAETTSDKQVADMFHGSQNITFEHNCIEARGFHAILENKTGIETDFDQNMQIRSNIFRSNDAILAFQGSWGAQTPRHESGLQNVVARNNLFVGLADYDPEEDAGGLVRFRFFHEVRLEGNEFRFETAGARAAAVFLQNRETTFVSNTLRNGTLGFNNALNNHEGAPYVGRTVDIVVEDNLFEDALTGPNQGVIDIRELQNEPEATARIESNEIRQVTPGMTAGPVHLRNVSFATIEVVNNSATLLDAADGVTQSGTNAIGALSESGNSWN